MKFSEGEEEFFSFHDFKNWMADQKDSAWGLSKPNVEDIEEKLIGESVISKVSKKKLIAKIDVDKGEPEELVNSFVENGGTITDVKEKVFLIETTEGVFYLPKFCVRISSST